MQGTSNTGQEPEGRAVTLPINSHQALEFLQPELAPLDFESHPAIDKLKLLAGPSRGPGAVVFPKVAPSTVVVRTGHGHGTGFIVDSEGWILTNNHVIAGATPNASKPSRPPKRG